MTSLIERLEEASYPDGLAEILMESLSVNADNYLAIKDSLYALRRLDEGQFEKVIALLNPGDQ